jgi:hypothetical protein
VLRDEIVELFAAAQRLARRPFAFERGELSVFRDQSTRNAEYYAANRELQIARACAWAKANPERKREINRKSRERNREKVRAKDRRYYAANRKKIIARACAWQRANRERKREYDRARRQARSSS